MRYREIIAEAKPMTTKQWQARDRKLQRAKANLQSVQTTYAQRLTKARQKLQQI